jgi:DNA-binding NarL/FixJ family response regulator
VLVADDHPVVHQGLQSCLAGQEPIRIVGEAVDGDEAVQKALALRPNLVVMDGAMPQLSVEAALRWLGKYVR